MEELKTELECTNEEMSYYKYLCSIFKELLNV